MQGCITVGDFEIGLGRVDDPTSDDPADAGWGIIIAPTDSNTDFEDTNPQNGNICLTCDGQYTMGSMPHPNDDPGDPGGCGDTFWGCEDHWRLDLGSSVPFDLSASSGPGTIFVFSSTGAYLSQQNHNWSASGKSVAPANASSLSGMVDYNLSMGNSIVYEARVPIDAYSPAGNWVVQHGTAEFGSDPAVTRYSMFMSSGAGCEGSPGSLPSVGQDACFGN